MKCLVPPSGISCWKLKKMDFLSWNLQKGNWGQWKCLLFLGDFSVVVSLGDQFEFTYYIRDSNYRIRPLEVMSVLQGARQLHFLVLGHCAEPVLGDIPRILTEYERDTQPRKAGKSVLLKWGKGCCLFSGFNPYKSKKGDKKISERTDLKRRRVKYPFTSRMARADHCLNLGTSLFLVQLAVCYKSPADSWVSRQVWRNADFPISTLARATISSPEALTRGKLHICN